VLTEAQRHQLYSELTAVLSTEGAAIIMDVVGSVAISELATRSDLAVLKSELKTEMSDLRTELKTDMADLKQDLTRTFATLLFVSQGVLVSIVGLLVALT
jgi:hypothetical protein